MVPLSSPFKNSIENDLVVNSGKLPFLDIYTIEAIEYDSKSIRIYRLSTHESECYLAVFKKNALINAYSAYWETENYTYHLIKKDE